MGQRRPTVLFAVVEDLAVCLAAGLPEFCGRPIYQRARVLLMTREDADDTTRERLWQLVRGRGVAHQDFVDWLEIDGTTPLYLDSPEDVTAFKETLARFDVVFIDSLSTVHNGDENLARDMIRVMNAWRDLARITRTANVLVHHLRKPGEGKMAPGSTGGRILTKSRGSGIIAAPARHAVCLADGPVDHQLAVKVEGNQEIMPAPFVIERRTGQTDGRKWVRHEAVGTELIARELAVAAPLDPAIIDVVAASGSEGVLMSALRVQVRSHVPARNNIIAARVAVLIAARVVSNERRASGSVSRPSLPADRDGSARFRSPRCPARPHRPRPERNGNEARQPGPALRRLFPRFPRGSRRPRQGGSRALKRGRGNLP